MMKNNQGLSLIEVLVSITILTIIGIAIATIVTRTFSGNTKTELIGNIKQNGQSALAVIEKDVRESETVVCTSPTTPPSTTLVLVSKDGGKYIRFSMIIESGATNGTIYREQLVFSSPITTTSQLCDFISFPLDVQGSKIALTDSISKSAVSLKNATTNGFTVVKNSGFKDTVRVQFDLGPSYDSGNTIENSIGGNSNSLNFQTTVQIR